MQRDVPAWGALGRPCLTFDRTPEALPGGSWSDPAVTYHDAQAIRFDDGWAVMCATCAAAKTGRGARSGLDEQAAVEELLTHIPEVERWVTGSGSPAYRLPRRLKNAGPA